MEMLLSILLGLWLVFAGVFYKVFVTGQFKMYRTCRQENSDSGSDATKGGAGA